MIAPEVAVEKLLGFDTAYAIADFLEGEGVKGHRGSSYHCPVAVWLTTITDVQASVAPTDLAIGTPLSPREWWSWSAQAPLTAFIRGFDSGRYPQLDAEQ